MKISGTRVFFRDQNILLGPEYSFGTKLFFWNRYRYRNRNRNRYRYRYRNIYRNRYLSFFCVKVNVNVDNTVDNY